MSFRTQGFVVVPGVLSEEEIRTGRKIVAGLLDTAPQPGPVSLWPQFGPDGHPLLDFYRQTRIASVAAGLLRSGPQDPGFAQVAITTPPFAHRPGGPHVDGLTPPEDDGRPGTFTMLAGVWLTDQSEPDHGNLWVWPGTHLRAGEYLAEHGPEALTRMPGSYPDVELGEPVQVTGPAGSVMFAHYLLAHNTGGHFGAAGDERRETLYFRLRAEGHVERWREAVTDPLLELS